MATWNVLRPVRVLAAFGVRAPRTVALFLACVMAVLTGVQPDAQSQAPPFFVPGRNVNTLGPILGPPPGGGPDPLSGNPYAKQRNEPSCDVSPYNQMVVLCAYNDYRGIPIFKDSWIGLSMTNNGGRTWFDRLLDGFPTSPQGIGAADPIVRAVPGLAVIAYITLDSNKSRGTLSIAHMLEKNRENGEPYQFFQRFVIDIGNSGRFLDKPDMEVVLDPLGGTIQIGDRQVPKGRTYFSYSVFTGTGPNGNGASIYNMYSDDYGQTWSNPKKLSASLGANQGVDMGVGDGGTVVTTWRQIADNNQADAIIFSRSTNKGQTWSQAAPLWTAPTAGRFFDQDTTVFQIRSLSMPTIVHDGTAFHTYFSARGFHSNPLYPEVARIVVSNSTDGLVWSPPAVVNPDAGRGHQIVPQAAVGGGSIQVDWIDTRNNDPQSFGPAIADFRYTLAADGTTYVRVPFDAAPPTSQDPPQFIYRTSADIYGVQGPVGGSQTYSDAQPISRYRFGLVTGETTARQLEYNFVNGRMFRTGTTPFNGDYHVVASQRYLQTDSGTWIRNAGPAGTDPNAGPMTNNALFYAAFPDNRDVRGFVWLGLSSTPYTPSGTTSQEAEGGLENATSCTSTGNNADSSTELTSPTDAPRSRFQNVYAAPIYPGLVVMSPSGSKPTSTALERAFVVFVQNLTDRDRTYQFTIGAPPNGVRASFLPQGAPADFPFRQSCSGTNCNQMSVLVGRASSATRTVYVKLTDATVNPRPKIRVKVLETSPGNTQTGSVLLNGMPADIAIETPDGLPQLLNIEGYQPDLLLRSLTISNAILINPDLQPPLPGTTTGYSLDGYPRDGYPRDGYPRDGYPRDGYPRDGYPRDGYHSLSYPRDGYPRDGYPRDGYSRLGNSSLQYSAISDTDLSSTLKVADLTWPVITAPPDSTGANYGNTVTGMSAQVFINGTIPPKCDDSHTTNCLKGAQLIVWVPHFYTAIVSCSGERATVFDNQIILNTVIKPEDLAAVLAGTQGPNTINPALSQPTFWVGPNQVVFSTLRLFGELTDTQFQNLASHTGTIVRSQPDISTVNGANDSQDGTIDTTAPALNLSNVGALAHVEGNTAGGANVTVSVTATDNSGSASVSCVRTQGTTSEPLPVDGTTSTFIPLGSWTGSCTATDSAGNTTSGQFPISVEDHTAPTLNVSGLAATVTLTPSVNGTILSYNPSVVTVSDLVDSTVPVVCTPPSGTTLAAGTQAIQCTASDDSGNTATATYSFTVAKASTTTTVTVANAVYDGSPHGATATVTGGGGLNQTLTVTYSGTGSTSYGPTTTAPTNVGTYSASAAYATNPGYEGSTDNKTYAITKATSTTIVTCPSTAAYTGSPVTPCSVSVTGAGGLSLSPTPVYSNNTEQGTATASYTYAGDGNHTSSSDSKTFTITVPYGFVVVSIQTSGNQGSAFPMSWRYTLNGAPFNSSSLVPVFRAVQLTSCNPNAMETSSIFDNQYAAGNSNFQFTSTSPYIWQYNWQTKAFIKGACYNIYILTKNGSGATLQKNLMGKVKLN